MFNIKGDKTPIQITTNIKDYAEALPEGLHLAWSSTSADITVVGQPVAGTGFMYEIIKNAGQPIQITAIPFVGINNFYVLRKHGSTWRPWVEFSGHLQREGQTTNTIAARQLSSDSITTVTWDGNAVVLLLKRSTHFCIIFMDYWSEGYTVIGELSNKVTITKNASSKTATIEYNTLNAQILFVIGENPIINATPKA